MSPYRPRATTSFGSAGKLPDVEPFEASAVAVEPVTAAYHRPVLSLPYECRPEGAEVDEPCLDARGRGGQE